MGNRLRGAATKELGVGGFGVAHRQFEDEGGAKARAFALGGETAVQFLGGNGAAVQSEPMTALTSGETLGENPL